MVAKDKKKEKVKSYLFHSKKQKIKTFLAQNLPLVVLNSLRSIVCVHVRAFFFVPDYGVYILSKNTTSQPLPKSLSSQGEIELERSLVRLLLTLLY